MTSSSDSFPHVGRRLGANVHEVFVADAFIVKRDTRKCPSLMGSGTVPEKVATSLLSQTTSFTLHILKNLVMAKVDLYGQHILVSFSHKCFDPFWDIEAPYGTPEEALVLAVRCAS